MTSILNIRHALHQIAEVSNQEFKTAKFIAELLEAFQPDRLITEVGGTGVVASFKGNRPGKTILLRAELDALPIKATSGLVYGSLDPDVSHRCGHDGHMAILVGVAQFLKTRDFKGEVILMFQPAEEIGVGAQQMLHDQKLG